MDRAARRRIEREKEKRRNDRVMIGFLSAGMVHHKFMNSVLDCIGHSVDTVRDGHLFTGNNWYISLISSPRIASSRTEIVKAFLRDSDAEWLWMIDTDMVFEGDALSRLMAVADKDERPIVGGLCFTGHPGQTKLGHTLYVMENDEDGRPMFSKADLPLDAIKEGGLVQVDATGAAFLLVHRSVFVRMAADHPHGFGTQKNGDLNPFPWFYEGYVAGGHQYGEDIAFCMRARHLGYPIYIHTGIRVGHIKPCEVDLDIYTRFEMTD